MCSLAAAGDLQFVFSFRGGVSKEIDTSPDPSCGKVKDRLSNALDKVQPAAQLKAVGIFV